MNTYSVNIGLSTESTTYNLLGATSTDLSTPLSVLFDNTSKQISPRDLRNSILTLYSNSIFTQTTSSGYEYVGIDTGNPSDRDLKNKIYLGKRVFSGTFSYNSTHDIMSNTLLNSDVDIFLYNTKRDSVSNRRTKIGILAGTSSDLRSESPYIQSEILSSTSSTSFDFINPSTTGGNINIYSGEYTSSTGTVSISNIIFPSFSDSYGLSVGLTGASNNKLLFWQNGQLIWNEVPVPTLTSVGTTASLLNIYGSPVTVNNYSLELTDNRYTPFSIGDLPLSTNFNNVSIVEVLRRIVYPYLPPNCSVDILSPYAGGYVEVGTSPLVKLSFSITKRSLPTLITGLSNMLPGSYPAITAPGQTTVTGTASGIVISPVANTTTTFTITASDGNQSTSQSKTLTGIYPYFYGFSALSTMTTAGLSSLTKLVEPLGDKTIDITGSGNLYFIYDSSYPDLDLILDDVNNVIGGSSSIYLLTTLSSPSGLWASKQFKVYKLTGIPQIGPPTVNYQFKY